MLKIQRASAGSGKTYALARNYIINLIAYKKADDTWVLRTKRQIEDGIQHILAITFTNKATNEMKQRIVKNLAELSGASGLNASDDDSINHIPYLKDFILLTKATPQEIGKTARIALNTILNNFSFFKISTIDSFFQEILRTFTYEANINDSYQLEIDSSFVADAALDAAISELDLNPDRMGNASFWLKTIIRNEAQRSQAWNPFNKKARSRSVYARLRTALAQLEKEEFKEIKETLDDYFRDENKTSRLPAVFSTLRQKALEERENNLKEIIRKSIEIENLILSQNIPLSYISSNFLKHLAKVRELKIKDSINFKYAKVLTDKSVFLKKYRTPGHPVDAAALEFYNLVSLWNLPPAGSYYKNWLIYGELLPFLGLILEVRSFLSGELENNNLIQLSDTSYILRRIIGEDDAPFIYERLGSRIDNYLIDEFQDTSKLQWDILYPLIRESDSKGTDSMIIGDPKQSIYRFRNANHRLITTEVPRAFPHHLEAGYSREENTNWRSHTNIVKFNNFLFGTLAAKANETSLENGIPTDFLSLYGNVEQYPHNDEGKGYVEINFLEKQESDPSDDTDNDEGGNSRDWFDNASMQCLGPLISSLLSRGYKMKDIGILVNTNIKGKEVVEALIDYNATLPDGEQKINFISEESLLVSSSPAVEIIIGVIEKLTKPALILKEGKETMASPEKEGKRKYWDWNRLKLHYNLFSLKNPDLTPYESINSFLENPYSDLSLSKLLESTPSPTMASIVEGLIGTFLDDELRASESLYISSFQDLVNEYSAGHPDDPASFLEWWNARGSRASVSSPDSIEAVQIMTIHKSKGLEFKCVIVPFATDSFEPSPFKEEWRWVEPVSLPGIELPPVLPITTGKALIGSAHEDIYREYFDQVLTDKLNMYYVAFTRAKNELYIFAKKPAKKTRGINNYLIDILSGEYKAPETVTPDFGKWSISPADIEISDNDNLLTLGTPLTKEEILNENKKGEKGNRTQIRFFTDYFVNKTRPSIRSTAARVLPSGELDLSQSRKDNLQESPQ